MEEKIDQRELTQALLSSRQAVYALLARLWAEALDEAAFAALVSSDWQSVLTLLDEEGGQGEASSDSLVQAYACIVEVAEQLGLERLQSAFNWCFMGIGTKVAPWESVYVVGERLIMQPCTLAVREAYAAAGFVACKKGSEPDDHVATECDFMAKLAERVSGTFVSGASQECGVAIAQSRAFLEEHLVLYAGDFTKAFEEAVEKARACDKERASDAQAFYGALAQFDEVFFAVDGVVLQEVSEAL